MEAPPGPTRSTEPVAEEAPPSEAPSLPKVTPGRVGSVAGVLTFLSSALGTVLLAVTNWGSDAAALDTARRNHVGWLVAAASFAIAGLETDGAAAKLFNWSAHLSLHDGSGGG